MPKLASEEDVEEFIVDFFQAKSAKKDSTRAELIKLDYFAAELVDSFGVIEMIGVIEETFQIQLEFSDFEYPDFKVVEGLIGIVRTKLD